MAIRIDINAENPDAAALRAAIAEYEYKMGAPQAVEGHAPAEQDTNYRPVRYPAMEFQAINTAGVAETMEMEAAPHTERMTPVEAEAARAASAGLPAFQEDIEPAPLTQRMTAQDHEEAQARGNAMAALHAKEEPAFEAVENIKGTLYFSEETGVVKGIEAPLPPMPVFNPRPPGRDDISR